MLFNLGVFGAAAFVFDLRNADPMSDLEVPEVARSSWSGQYGGRIESITRLTVITGDLIIQRSSRVAEKSDGWVYYRLSGESVTVKSWALDGKDV